MFPLCRYCSSFQRQRQLQCIVPTLGTSRELMHRVSTTRLQLAMKRQLSAGIGSTTTQKSTSPTAKGVIGTVFLCLLAVSDPVSSFITDDDENTSYWMQQHLQNKNVKEEGGGTNKQSRLRNSHKHCNESNVSEGHDCSNVNNLPNYSRIVIVGGGMAGLHTALALSERLHNPNSQAANPPAVLPSKRWSLFQKRTKHIDDTTKTKCHNEIIVLERCKIGNGASGRAKGLAAAGFQVPLENLQENALDSSTSSHGWTVPGLVYSFSNILGLNDIPPRYTKDVVEQMYDLSYEAMDRLRDIVKLYEIDCDWIESGFVEATIHPMEGEETDESDGDDGCISLTASQVNNIVGRLEDDGNNQSLYKGGEYDPSCAAVDPLALTLGLADTLESMWGVRIYEQTRVVKLEKNCAHSKKEVNGEQAAQGKYTIVTDQGETLQCDHVVLCTGADVLSNQVLQSLTSSFVPVYTWMVATEPLKEKCPLKSGILDRLLSESSNKDSNIFAPMCGDDHVALNYWRNNNNEDEGRLLFGSLADTYLLPKWLISLRLRNSLSEIYPNLSNVKFDLIWGGKLAFPLNSMPLIGRDKSFDDNEDIDECTKSGVWYATGFAGHGIVSSLCHLLVHLDDINFTHCFPYRFQQHWLDHSLQMLYLEYLVSNSGDYLIGTFHHQHGMVIPILEQALEQYY